MNQTKKVGVAVVGAGYWGPNLVRNLTSLDCANLVAICDSNPSRLQEVARRYEVTITASLEEILDRDDIAAVFIATPAETHFELGKQCLLAGKHVYIEKPLATTSADARHLCEMAEQLNRVLMVGHLFLYEPATLRLIEMAHAGTIGALRYAHGLRISMSGTARLDTNIIWDALIHDAYIQPALFGRVPDKVLVVGGKYLRPDVEDVVFAAFDFGGGTLSHNTASWYAVEKTRTLSVIGSEGMITYDGLSGNPLTHYDRRYVQSDALDPMGRPYWRWINGQGKVIPVAAEEPLREECTHFLHCVIDRSRPRTDGWAGLKAVEIIEACARSVAKGGVWQPVMKTELVV